jgi:serine/threonine protein kinase
MDLWRRLREGKADDVSSYIRDALNDAENINNWNPSAAMPLAIALAESSLAGVAPNKLYESARAILEQWYDSLPVQNTTRFVYDQKQLDDHRRILDEKRIFRGHAFASSLLESWLAGFRVRVSEQDWSSLLLKAAIRKIRFPEPIQILSGVFGSQAQIGTFTRDNKKYAIRFSELRSDADRAKFAQTCEMLGRLKNAVDDRSPGSEYVFKLLDFGLSAEDDTKAVQAYRWVEGENLLSRTGTLPPAYVADLGLKLTQAVRFLHNHEILHRDLSRRNIILQEEGGDPIVIDFGFARSLSEPMNSNIDSDEAAPEVRGSTPNWTKAADVYAVGASLKRVLDPQQRYSPLIALLDRATSDRLEDRPTADDLAKGFQQIAKDLDVEQRKVHAWQQVVNCCGKDYAIHWFRKVVDKFEGNFTGAALGCYPLQFARCLAAASFLNQVVETYSHEANRPKENLGDLDRSLQTGKADLALLYSLRNYANHGGKVQARAVENFRRLPENEMMREVLNGANFVSGHASLQCIPKVVTCLLEPLSCTVAV